MFDMCSGCCIILYKFVVSIFFFYKQKTAYERRISDWSSDVCSSDLVVDSSAVVSAIGTSWNQDPSLPGCRPMRTNCALMYSTVFSPPGVPGPRPSNSSEASVFTSSVKSPVVMSSLKAYAGTVAAASGAVVDAASAGVGSRMHAASAVPASRQNRRCRVCIREALCGGNPRILALEAQAA